MGAAGPPMGVVGEVLMTGVGGVLMTTGVVGALMLQVPVLELLLLPLLVWMMMCERTV